MMYAVVETPKMTERWTQQSLDSSPESPGSLFDESSCDEESFLGFESDVSIPSSFFFKQD